MQVGSNVLEFPRARRAIADGSRSATLIRVRIVARVAGCNYRQREQLARAAGEHLDLGVKPDRVVEKARSLAEAMVRTAYEPVSA